jgi:hypothetical protein
MRFPLEESIVAATAATTESLPALKTGQTHKPTSTKIKTFAKEKEKPLNLYESEYDIQLQKEYEEYRRVYGSIHDKEEKESKT